MLATNSPEITYEQFCESWADELRASVTDEMGQVNKPALRKEFVRRLLGDYLGAEHDLDESFIYIETGPTNGIDAILLEESDLQEDGSEDVALSAYVVRFLLPSDLNQPGNIVSREAAKIRDTLQNAPLEGDLYPVLDLWRSGGSSNCVEFVFASASPLTHKEQEAVFNAEATFDSIAPHGTKGAVKVSAQAVSLHTIYTSHYSDKSVQVPLAMNSTDAEAQSGLIIGAVSLLDLYAFLKDFRAKRSDLDALYEKNVRLFLGRTGKINKGISATLRKEPENFGLYNNGLTIVSRDVTPTPDGSLLLTDPFVVNGCQTTRTIWETLSEQLKAPPESDVLKREGWQSWREKLESGRVVVKIVRVAPGEIDDDDLRLENITRFTNSQNAVKEKDFIALDRDFKRWKRELAVRGIFLKILRNEGTAQLARQKPKHYSGVRYAQIAKAFEFFKVYGAGWMNEPGDAWNKNSAFVPKGAIFKAITSDENHFGGDDLMAALHLQNAAAKQKFGKSGAVTPASRRLTKFLFYRTAVELMRRLLRRLQLPHERADCTRAVLALQNSNAEWERFIRDCTEVIDSYMNSESDYPASKEPGYDGDFNAFLKKSALAKSQDSYPQLWNAWNIAEIAMKNDTIFMNKAEPVLRTALS